MTENLEALRKLDGSPAVAVPATPAAKPMTDAAYALSVAEADHRAVEAKENRLRIDLAATQREVGMAAQRLAAAYKAYDLSLQQERRAKIDPAAVVKVA